MFQNKIRYDLMVLIFLACFVALFALSYALLSPPEHDYISYMEQWDAVIQGHNAYANKANAYGPLHSTLSFLYSIHLNLPRLFFVALWLISSFGLSFIIKKNNYLLNTYKYALYVMLFLNPLFWIFIVKYGTNDILMTFFVLCSIFLFKKNKDTFSGFFLAIAIAVKFIPVVMIPFLIFSRDRIRWNFVFSLGFTLVFIFGVSYFLWGNEILHPLQMGHQRPSKILSIFRFLRGEFSPIGLFTDKPNFDWASTYLILISISAFFLLHIKYRLEGILSSIIAFGILLTLYKVGHQQFYITLTMLIILWIGLDYKMNMDLSDTLKSSFAFLLWISFVSFLYGITDGYSGTSWREILGLPTFIVSCWMLINYIRYSLNVANQARSNRAY